MIFCFFKKKKDPIAWFEGEDPKMLEAIALVRSSFGKFVATA